MSPYPTSPDDRDFEAIYQALPAGIVLVACGGGYFRPLQSFCFSLKGAAIRLGTDAAYFDWNGSREKWDEMGGIQYFKEFIRQYATHGVRVFLNDASPQTGPADLRLAELLRSPMMRNSMEQDIADSIQQAALAENVTVIVTAIAEIVAQEQINQAVIDLDAVIKQKQEALRVVRGGVQEIQRQFALPDAEAAIAALPNDVAEQIREARTSLPKTLSQMEQCQTDISDLISRKNELKRKKSPSRLMECLKMGMHSGSWKGILLEQDRPSDGSYSARVADGREVERYGPLYFVCECPERPKIPLRTETVVLSDQFSNDVPVEHRRSWFRRLFC